MDACRKPVSQLDQVTVAVCPTYSGEHIANALAEALSACDGLKSVIKPGQTVLVKPNLFSPHAPDEAVTTHPELVRQVVRRCFEAGAGRVWVGDSPVGTHLEAELWDKTGMSAAVAGTPAELKSFQVRQMARPCGEDVLAVPAWLAEVDTVISLPKLKTHCLTTITCGIKNVYGMVSGQAKAQFHTKYPSPLTMSEFLVRVYGAVRPQLTIADAVVAMEGNGPAHGRPRPVGVLLASRDAVALDAVGCATLGIAPASVPMIRLAAAAGLGTMTDIECVGSGMPVLNSARLKPSLSRILKHFPEWAFGVNLRLMRMRPKIRIGMCVKCGMCGEACPRQAIEAESVTGYPVIDNAKCIDCFCCLESCPQSAIAVQYSLANLFKMTRSARKSDGSK